jgi:uncharacterized alkaline shock family protein YloU
VRASEDTSGFRIALPVLEAIVKGALDEESRVRAHQSAGLGRSKSIDIASDGRKCRVEVHLDARFGEDLRGLGSALQERIARTLSRMTGLTVEGVTIVFAGVFPPMPAPASDDR